MEFGRVLIRSQQAPGGQPERGREPVRSVVGAGGEDARHGDGVHGQVGAAVGDGLTGGLGGERDRVDQIVAAVGDLPDPDEDRGPGVERAHRAIARAWLSTTLPFWVDASTTAPSPSRHTFVTMVSSGHTWSAKRPSSVPKASTSPPNTPARTARPTKPKVHRPWLHGASKPAICANSGSMWRGLRSPDRR